MAELVDVVQLVGQDEDDVVVGHLDAGGPGPLRPVVAAVAGSRPGGTACGTFTVIR
jgi:hypothetical protein